MSEEHDWTSSATRGAVISTDGKARITLYIDDDVLSYWRELATSKGRGYNTEINDYLRAAMTRPQIVNEVGVKCGPDAKAIGYISRELPAKKWCP